MNAFQLSIFPVAPNVAKAHPGKGGGDAGDRARQTCRPDSWRAAMPGAGGSANAMARVSSCSQPGAHGCPGMPPREKDAPSRIPRREAPCRCTRGCQHWTAGPRLHRDLVSARGSAGRDALHRRAYQPLHGIRVEVAYNDDNHPLGPVPGVVERRERVAGEVPDVVGEPDWHALHLSRIGPEQPVICLLGARIRRVPGVPFIEDYVALAVPDLEGQRRRRCPGHTHMESMSSSFSVASLVSGSSSW